MCYIVVKNTEKRGCYALKTRHGNKLIELKRKLEEVANKNVQVVLISRPSAYCEYAPYSFAETEDELVQLTKQA
ncbi:MAG: hypothetical protein K6F30_05915 [Lachnospiraceae bacterium]|nr:hypothetical protein [Lachnospiraceae bacterium]